MPPIYLQQNQITGGFSLKLKGVNWLADVREQGDFPKSPYIGLPHTVQFFIYLEPTLPPFSSIQPTLSHILYPLGCIRARGPYCLA